MKKYKPLLTEWLPSEFEKARQSGVLDYGPYQHQAIPEYLEIFTKRYDIDIKNLKSKVKDNKISFDNSRVVIWNNNFYSCDGRNSLHYDILIYLILYKGLKIKNIEIDSARTLESYWMFYKTNDFLCLQMGEHKKINYEGIFEKNYGLYLAESYWKNMIVDLTSMIAKNKHSWSSVINKIERQKKVRFFPEAF